MISTRLNYDGSFGIMNISFVLPSLSGGGAERALISIANHIARQEKVSLVVGRCKGPYLEDVSKGVHIHDLKTARNREMIFALRKYARTTPTDVFVSALVPADVALLTGKALGLWNTKIVLSVQNNPDEVGRNAPRLGDRAWPTFIKLLYGRADAIVGISEGVAASVERLLGRAPGSIPVINNPVVSKRFFSLYEESCDHPWFRDGAGPVLVAAGRLTAQKDYPTLLKAVALAAQKSNVRLIVLGEGELREELATLASTLGISDRVDFVGFQRNPYAFMRSADLFVLSSRWEGFANVVAEALACGTRVVSTDCPSGPAEILAGGTYGRLAPVGDAEALAAGILAELAADRSQEELARRGQSYTVEALAPKYLEIIRGIYTK